MTGKTHDPAPVSGKDLVAPAAKTVDVEVAEVFVVKIGVVRTIGAAKVGDVEDCSLEVGEIETGSDVERTVVSTDELSDGDVVKSLVVLSMLVEGDSTGVVSSEAEVDVSLESVDSLLVDDEEVVSEDVSEELLVWLDSVLDGLLLVDDGGVVTVVVGQSSVEVWMLVVWWAEVVVVTV